MISNHEIELVRNGLKTAQEAGAQKVRARLVKSEEDLVATLNGEVDRVTHCADCSLSLALFVDGRFGNFSTNKLDPASLENFIRESVEITRMISEDDCRDLPDPQRYCRNATEGNELGASDPFRAEVSPEMRSQIAIAASVFDDGILSEEGEYSDSIYEVLVMDSNGLFCRHCETSFDYAVELTIEHEGEKYSGYYWDSSAHFSELKAGECGMKALERAKAQIGSAPAESGRYNMVVSSDVASKLVSPILRALNAFAIQQNNSFLMDSVGKKLFPEGMHIVDLPHIKGSCCSKLFDSEGVATSESAIIEAGTVRQYFVNTYMSNKTGLAPTSEDATRPKLMPWPKSGMDRESIMKMCSDGILVTEFNGGNCNSTTGDFSYGIEGFLFKDGKIERPVSEMLVTGNFISLWNSLLAAGDDARPCMSKLIPTLAFSNVDFSG